MPNADAGNLAVAEAIARYCAAHPDRAHAFASLGARRYLSLLAWADVCLGNSSSGVIEAPALGTPTVDVGERQAGRDRAAGVLHCEAALGGDRGGRATGALARGPRRSPRSARTPTATATRPSASWRCCAAGCPSPGRS